MKWTLIGYDTFDFASYPLAGEYDSEAEAIAAAQRELADIERTQPTASSGGQDGIQDQVFVVAPDGTSQRIRL